MFWFVPYISDPVWNFTYVAYSLASSKPAKNTKGQCFWHTLSDNCIFIWNCIWQDKKRVTFQYKVTPGAGLTVNIKYVLKDHCTIIMYILFIENWQQNNTCIILFVFMKQSTFMYTHILVIKQS